MAYRSEVSIEKCLGKLSLTILRRASFLFINNILNLTAFRAFKFHSNWSIFNIIARDYWRKKTLYQIWKHTFQVSLQRFYPIVFGVTKHVGNICVRSVYIT